MLKGLSIPQPWASLITWGEKRIYTRARSTTERGWIAIHASQAYPEWARLLCQEAPFSDVLAKHIPDHEPGAVPALATGAIVGIARIFTEMATEELVRHREHGYLTPHERAFGDFSPGRYGVIFSHVAPLPAPVPVRGMPGFFPLPVEIEAEVWSQLPAWKTHRIREGASA